MKFSLFEKVAILTASPPARGAWIEMMYDLDVMQAGQTSPPARGAWIEMSTIYASFIGILLSLPARGAWIEIMMEGYSIYRMLSDRAKDLKAKADAK